MENALGKKVRDAYLLAFHVHHGESRKSGEPYITHPLAVARILFDAGADADVICAALLHDALESQPDAYMIANKIYTDFGDQVLFLVQAVSKDDRIKNKLEQQEAYMQQVQRAFKIDIFAFFIKIADLIHNMSTLGSLPKKRKQQWFMELQMQYLPLFSEYFHRIPLAHRGVFRHLVDRIEEISNRYESA